MLQQIIRDRIAQHGFITVADYMQLCLLHPEHGYYTTQNVFGAAGDFITAPEISQLFGEILGIWAILEWQRLGQPHLFNLVEFGPGHGTLMRDVLRGVTHIAPFKAAVQVHFVEASPQLQDRQRTAVETSGVTCQWHADISTLDLAVPTLVIANEFFDALPIHQFITQNHAWHERVLIQDADRFIWSYRNDPMALPVLPDATDMADGVIFEYADAAHKVFDTLCTSLMATSGSMVFIDYGDYLTPRLGDTLQALKHHRFVDVLDAWDHADITAHVDFYALDHLAQSRGLKTTVMNQGEFLKLYGIEQRLHVLMERASDAVKDTLQAGYHRLTALDQMGHLFKVLLVQTS